MNKDFYSAELNAAIIQRLTNDGRFQFKKSGDELQNGICPKCGKKEAWVKLTEPPFRVSCHRLNNCGWSAFPKELYPDLFGNFKERFPYSDDNPTATADAYLRIRRGFDLSVIKGMYEQKNAYNKARNEHYPSVKCNITPTCYQLKLIDAEDIKRNGSDQKIVKPIDDPGYKNIGWIPPGMEFRRGDEIWITEAIFKSMALLHLGLKSIASLSAMNFPRDIIRKYAGKNITWVLAYDNDPAGHTGTVKYRRELEAMGERYLIAFTRGDYEDWDDALKKGKLDAAYIKDSFYRGRLFSAESHKDKAFFLYCKNKDVTQGIFDFANTMWRYKVKLSDGNSIQGIKYPDEKKGWNLPDKTVADYQKTFLSCCDLEEIAPCRITFLYQEQDTLTLELLNTFRLDFANDAPPRLVSSDGTMLRSPDNFSNMILKIASVPFWGSVSDIKMLYKRWFFTQPRVIESVKYIGYVPAHETYVFPYFAFRNGRRIELHPDGYYDCGDGSMLKLVYNATSMLDKVDDFTGEWINDYYGAYSMNGMILLAWWIGTLFADQIRRRHASWPFLDYTGDLNAGKSTHIRFLWRCMGMLDEYEGLSPERGTLVALSREMEYYSNLPCVILEAAHDGADGKAAQKQFDFNSFKTFFGNRGVLRSVGVKNGGNETRKLYFRGGLLVSQNAPVAGDRALQSRFVHCRCTSEHFTPENGVMAERLEELTVKQLGGMLPFLLSREEPLLDGFFRQYKTEREAFEKRNAAGLIRTTRILHCHAQVAAWVRLLPEIFGARLSAEQLDAVVDHLWELAVKCQLLVQTDPPALEQFWDAYEYLNGPKLTTRNGKTVVDEILNHSCEPGLIAINMPHMRGVAGEWRVDLPPETDLTGKLFYSGKRHKCLGRKTVHSRIEGRKMACWVFEKGAEQ